MHFPRNKGRNEKMHYLETFPFFLFTLLVPLWWCWLPSEVLENSIFMTNVVLASIHRNNSVVKFYDNVKVETIECETTFSGRRSISIPIQCFFPFEVRLGRSSELHFGWTDDNIFSHRFTSILPRTSICLSVGGGGWVDEWFSSLYFLLFPWWKKL